VTSWSRPSLGSPPRRPLRLATFAVTGVLLGIAFVEALFVIGAVTGDWSEAIGSDLHLYLGYTNAWLDTGAWYRPEQLVGPYSVEDLSANVYPPTLLYLTVPFALGLPIVLWWAIPGALLAAALWRSRPAWWAWPIVALVLCYPRTWVVAVTGNPALWAIACAVAGVIWGWPAVGATVKLTFAPFALVGITRRSWWIAAAFAVLLAVPFASLWLDYVTVLQNAQSTRGLGYVLGEWPIAIGLMAVALSGRRGSIPWLVREAP
jgi:hypothetical protein